MITSCYATLHDIELILDEAEKEGAFDRKEIFWPRVQPERVSPALLHQTYTGLQI